MIWWQREGPAQVAKRIAVNQALRSDRAFEILRRLAGARQGRWDDPESLRKNSAAYSREIFARLAPHCPPAGRVLEIGPGTSLGVAKLFAARGHESHALDKFPWDQSAALDDVYAELGVRSMAVQRTLGPAEAIPFPDGHFAFVYSNSVLEHVSDPLRVAREISRVLIPGGVTAHSVDVNDHRDYQHPLEFLSIPHRVWDAMYSRKSSYHNRHRASQFRLAFGTVFEATDIRPTHQLSRAAVGDPRRFAPGFRELDVEDLAIVEFVLVARKKYAPLAQS